MKKRILAFGASSSSKSINRILAHYTAEQLNETEVDLLDLNDFEMPIFSVDREERDGYPEQVHEFLNRIDSADGIIISFAEHNGAYSAAFKNIYDWASRIRSSVWGSKPMFLLATSPGNRGAATVLEIASTLFQRRKSNVAATFSLPSFKDNFSREEGITHPGLRNEFSTRLGHFGNAVMNGI